MKFCQTIPYYCSLKSSYSYLDGLGNYRIIYYVCSRLICQFKQCTVLAKTKMIFSFLKLPRKCHKSVKHCYINPVIWFALPAGLQSPNIDPKLQMTRSLLHMVDDSHLYAWGDVCRIGKKTWQKKVKYWLQRAVRSTLQMRRQWFSVHWAVEQGTSTDFLYWWPKKSHSVF